jgi:hypothetical protein
MQQPCHPTAPHMDNGTATSGVNTPDGGVAASLSVSSWATTAQCKKQLRVLLLLLLLLLQLRLLLPLPQQRALLTLAACASTTAAAVATVPAGLPCSQRRRAPNTGGYSSPFRTTTAGIVAVREHQARWRAIQPPDAQLQSRAAAGSFRHHHTFPLTLLKQLLHDAAYAGLGYTPGAGQLSRKGIVGLCPRHTTPPHTCTIATPMPKLPT